MDTYLRERYKLHQMLDKGGMSKIYLAHDTFSEQQVVIKKIHIEDAGNMMEMYKRLQHEYRFLSRINHPYIIKAYDFFEEQKSFYLVLEYAEGMALDYLLYKEPFVQLPDTIAIAIQISEAVNILNSAGIIHRDIKPSNIIINQEKKQIKLVDLGISKSLNMEMTNITKDGMTVGTIDYMSPEQIMGKVSCFTDVFALAITLFQIITWQSESPFNDNSVTETMKKVLHSQLPDILTIINSDSQKKHPETYQQLAHLLQNMSHKNPEKRPRLSSIIEELRSLHNKLSPQYQTSWNILPQITTNELRKLESLGIKYGYNI